MTAKEYLSGYIQLSRQADDIEESITRIRQRFRPPKRSRDGDLAKLEAATERLTDRLIEVQTKALGRAASIMETIDGLQDPVYRRVLHLKYIDGLEWEYIAARLGCSKRHAQRLHGYALLEVVPPEEK